MDDALASIDRIDRLDVQGAPEDALRAAMEVHRGGRSRDAARVYRAVLEAHPEHPDAMHLLGLVEMQFGRLKAALELIARAVELRPAEAMFRNNLGNVFLELDRLPEAEAQFRAALEVEPTRLDTLNNVGVLLGRQGELEAAERTLKRVALAAPQFSDARLNLATLYMRTGRPTEAVREAATALITQPRHPGLRRQLGSAYCILGMEEQARKLYGEWLREEPDNPVAAHHVAALSGGAAPERASDAYVQRIFDGFASSFDAKLAQLEYRAPQLVLEAVRRACGEPAKSLRVADAGCGTGLCGPLITPWARHLAGVDLSAGMLTRAQERGGYDTLAQADLVVWLGAHPQAFDLLISADTLCYFGRLEDSATAARTSLADGGHLIFTVESHDEARDFGAGPLDHHLQPNGRYSHRQSYLRRVLGAAGFGRIDAEAVTLRLEAAEPVRGWLVTATAGPARGHDIEGGNR